MSYLLFLGVPWFIRTVAGARALRALPCYVTGQITSVTLPL